MTKLLQLTAVCLTAAFFLFAENATAQSGTLDPTFDTDGIASTNLGGTAESSKGLVVQTDGKIVVAGSSYINQKYQHALVRYNADGSIDQTFGTNGQTLFDLLIADNLSLNANDYIEALAVQKDGKLVVTGSCGEKICVARYLANGKIDSSFNQTGIWSQYIDQAAAIGYGIAIQSDQKIVVTGRATNKQFDNDILVVRLNPDGTLDTGFNNQKGYTTISHGTSNEWGESLALQNDGKIVIASYTSLHSDDISLCRLNTDGRLDSTFGTNGLVVTSIGSGSDVAQKIMIQGDGKIVVAGFCKMTNVDFLALRYLSNGTLDPSFDTDGIVTMGVGTSTDRAYDALIQPDGKIILAGESFNGSYENFALVRLNSNGSLDTAFGTNGKNTSALSTNSDVISAIALQSDGKILATGYTTVGYYTDFALVRYTNSIGSDIKNEQQTNGASVFYNSTGNNIFIHIPAALIGNRYVLYDAFGKKIQSGILQNETTTIQPSGLSRGLYFVQLNGVSFKLIKR